MKTKTRIFQGDILEYIYRFFFESKLFVMHVYINKKINKNC